MVSVLTLSAVDGRFETWLDQSKDLKLEFSASPLNTQQ